MDRVKKERIIAACLVIMFAALFSKTLVKGMKKKRERAEAIARYRRTYAQYGKRPTARRRTTGRVRKKVKRRKVVKAREKLPAGEEVLRDPFLSPVEIEWKFVRPTTVVKAQLPPLRIQGVLWGGRTSMVIIDGKFFKAGESFGEIEIVNIDDEGIHLLYRDEIVVIKPWEEFVQKMRE